jgi:hypothetical protein
MKKLFLLFAGVGLATIGLSYGVVPATLLPKLFGFSVDNINLIHISRAIMFAYFGVSAFWVYSAFKPKLNDAAIVAVIFFMTVLALGRILSIVLDGMPHWLLVLYVGAELGIAGMGLWVLRTSEAKE